jgi:hypothetical protein
MSTVLSCLSNAAGKWLWTPEVLVIKPLHGVTNGRDEDKLGPLSNQKRKFRMKRIAALTLLVALAAGWWMPIEAQDADVPKSDRQSEKLAQRQQKALYQYQKKQGKAQEKAQRRSDKQQRKAAKKYEKEQRRILKNSKLPVKQTP